MYRIFLSRILTTSALGIYSIALGIFGVFNTILASGTPIAISQLVSERKDNSNFSHKMVTVGFIFSISLSIIICVLLLLFKNTFTIFTHDNTTFLLLLTMLPAIISTGAYSSFRGYLWGKEEFLKSSIVEFIEQILRIAICIIIFALFKNINSIYPAGISFGIAGVISTIIGISIYFKIGGKLKKPKMEFKPFIKSSLPITTVRLCGSIVFPIISLILPFLLISVGYSSNQAMSSLGIMLGMTLPLISIPSTVIGALAMALIPKITAEKNSNNNTKLNNQINSSVIFTIIITFLFTPAFLSMGEPICNFIFNNNLAGTFLSYACWIMIPMGLSQITSSILNALGYEIKALIYYVISSILLVLCIIILPQFIGIKCIIYGIGLSNLLLAILNIYKLNKITNLNKNYFFLVFKLVLFILPCTLLTYFCYNIFTVVFPQIISLILGGAISVISFIILLLIFNILDINLIKNKLIKLKHNKIENNT